MDNPDQLRRVKAHRARRCPYCESNKWQWLGAEPITVEELDRYLLVRYRCKKCNNEFISEEAKRAKLTDKAEQCVHCNSARLKKVSRPDADIDLWQCLQCHGYMAVASGNDVTTAQTGITDNTDRTDLKLLRLHAKQRCPHCGSAKWDELGVEHDTSTTKIGCVIRYQCVRCREEFLVEDRGLTKMVQSADRCAHCGSSRLERDPRPNGPENMWRCRQCRGWMVVLPFVDDLEQEG